MDGRFAKAIAKAAADTPMASYLAPAVPGRVLLADGDGLAYYCAGNDDTDPGRAKQNMKEKLNAARIASRSETVRVLVTAASSHKGYRYAVARVKPYQGQRKNSRKPRNWQYLRELLDAPEFAGFEVEQSAHCEADDRFSFHGKVLGYERAAILTQDKDMRMVPGVHLDWTTHTVFTLRPDVWSVQHNDKLYGRHWFWTQMLMGDTADNIPGLPKYRRADDKLMLCGEKTAAELLAGLDNDAAAFSRVRELYEGYYAEDWSIEMLEQAALLWMRTDASAGVLNVTAGGNPLEPLRRLADGERARTAILARVAEAMMYEEAEGK